MNSRQWHRWFFSHVMAWFGVIVWFGAASAAAQDPRDVAPIELEPCHVTYVEELAQCGTLEVPENYADPASKKISLHIAILPPSGGQPTKAPLYFLAGGPGQAASEQGKLYRRIMRRIRRGRNLVLIDQRGTGQSNPLSCTIPDNPLAEGGDVARACLDDIDQNTQFYDSAAFIRDLEAVRAALGHERISLMGISYGTRAALLYAKSHEARVEAMILDSVAPPNVPVFGDADRFASDVLTRTIDACADTPDCADAFPDLRGNLDQLLAQLEQTPLTVDIPESDEGITITVDDEMFLSAFRGALYSPPSARLIPYIVDRAINGDYRPWLAIGDFGGLQITDDISFGLLLSVQCAEEAPLLKDTVTNDTPFYFANSFNEFWKTACAIWPSATPPAGFNEPVSVATPTLLFSGGLDPVTPPALGAIAAETLQNARHIVVPEAGHSVIAYGCTNRVMAAFLDDPDPQAVDGTCLDKLGPPAFLVGQYGPNP